MSRTTLRVARLLLICTLFSATCTGVMADPEPTEAAGTDAGATATAATAAEEPAVEIPLDCSTQDLLERFGDWSVDCVALWLDNLGFTELKTAFMGNKIDGVQLKLLTMEKLADEYGVSDIDQRKKIYYSLKDMIKKDYSSGNSIHFWQMIMWILPFAAFYLYLSLKYEKQIGKIKKRYNKWQDARNPPKPPEPVVFSDGTNEWTSGMNNDLGNGGKANKKERKKERVVEKDAAKSVTNESDAKKVQ